MNKLTIILLLAATSACTGESEEQQLENSMRAELSKQGEVKEVDLTSTDDDNLAGHAVVGKAGGPDMRMKCTARRTEETKFDWQCQQEIDEAVLTNMENAMRAELAKQAEVVGIELRKEGDDRMVGPALVRDATGAQVEMSCSATRTGSDVGDFAWECAPPTS